MTQFLKTGFRWNFVENACLQLTSKWNPVQQVKLNLMLVKTKITCIVHPTSTTLAQDVSGNVISRSVTCNMDTSGSNINELIRNVGFYNSNIVP